MHDRDKGTIFARIPESLKDVFAKRLRIDGIKIGEFIEACVRLYLEERAFSEKVQRKIREMRMKKE